MKLAPACSKAALRSSAKALLSALSAFAVSMPFAVVAAPAQTAKTMAGAGKDVPTEVIEIAEKVQASKQKIVEAESEKRKILGSLYSINQRMKKISHEKSHLTDELFHVQDSVKSIAKVIASLETQIGKQRQQLRKRLRALYKLSGEGFLAIVFSQTSIKDLDESLRFLKIVTENDYRLIRSYQENVALYKAQKNKLKGQVERLVSIEKKIKKQEGLLAHDHKEKTKIVSELDRQRIDNLKRIKTLRTKTAKLDEVGDLLKPSIFEKRGQLASPIQGSVVQDFGPVIDDRYRIRLSHKGWRFEAAPGTVVSAVFEGSVVFSEWLEGYGHTLVLDHGDHYYTVYGHISRVKARVGDTLKSGQVFAEAGAATRRYRPGLYFEIRHFSEPENPANWISSKQFQISRSHDDQGGESAKRLAKDLAKDMAKDMTIEISKDIGKDITSAPAERRN